MRGLHVVYARWLFRKFNQAGAIHFLSFLRCIYRIEEQKNLISVSLIYQVSFRGKSRPASDVEHLQIASTALHGIIITPGWRGGGPWQDTFGIKESFLQRRY